MKNSYEFKDLFDADLNQMKFGQNQRAKVSVGQLENLEKMYPKSRKN